MHKIKIVSVGKTKEMWLEEAMQEYMKRLKSHVGIEFEWVKTDEQLLKAVESTENAVGLDPSGKQFSSEAFSDYLMHALEKGGSRLALIIGGSEGLPLKIKENIPLFSLSKMTFTHQITRLVLLEQIYRAFEIAKGSKYHK